MKWGRLVVLLGAVTLWPHAAYAAAGWWAWLEELSGPGPFHGYVLSAPVLCFRDHEIVRCWREIPPGASEADAAKYRPKRLIFFSVGSLGSGDNLRFKDLPDTPENRREVNVLQLSASYMFRVHQAVDLGFGAGAMRFSGDGFEPLWRFTLIPATVSVRLLALHSKWKDQWWSSLLRADAETSIVTSGFTAAQFGSPTSTFSVGREILSRGALVIDVGSFIWK